MKLKKLNMQVLVLLCLGFFITYCGVEQVLDGGSQDATTEVKYVYFRDFGCKSNSLSKDVAGASTSQITYDDRNYVKGFTYHNDTLALEIHYIANCCPDFADNVTITGNNIEIYLQDKWAGCLCMCEYENLFCFYAPAISQTHVKFNEKGPYEQNYRTMIDTVFTVN